LPVVRALLLLVTVATVLLAVVTTTGRVAVALLARYEPEINTLLRSRGVELGGLSGTWHWLNPIVRIDSARFVGGRASGITFEVDLLESAWHGALVARDLLVQRIDLAPLQDAAGHWHVGAAGGDGNGAAPAAFEALLRYSDVLQFPDVRVRFVAADAGPDDAPLGELHGSVNLHSAMWDHAGALKVRAVQGGQGSVALSYAIREGIFGNPSRGRIALRADPLTIEPGFGIALGGAGIAVDALRGDWSFQEGASTGELQLDAHDIALPTGRLERVDVAARGVMQRFGWRWALAFDRLHAEAAGGSVDLDGTSVALVNALDGSHIEVALAPVDVDLLNAVVAAAAGPSNRIGEWLIGLDPHGRLERAVARIDLTSREIDYTAAATGIALENFKGVPYVRNGAAVVAGTEHALDIKVDGRDMSLGFFDFYDHAFQFDALSGDLLMWFRPGYFALSGTQLAATIGRTHAAGQFAIGRPDDPLEQRVFAAAQLRDIDGRAALAYVPHELGVYGWLDSAVSSGTLDVVDLLYHGHFRVQPELPMRQLELAIDARDAAVRFHPDWPILDAVDGHVTMTGSSLRGEITRARLAGLTIKHAALAVPAALDSITVQGDGSGDASALRTLFDQSPLASWLTFVKPDWTFGGPFDFGMRMSLPFTAEGGSPDVALNLNLRGVDVMLAELDLPIAAMRGALDYRYPLDVEAHGIDAVVFDNPARLTAASADGEVRIGFTGRADAHALSDWRRVPDPDLIVGPLDFAGEYRIRPGSSASPVLTVHSDLIGTTLNLPAPLGKPAADALPSSMTLSFGTDEDLLDLRVGDVLAGWLRIGSSGVRAGRIGIGVQPVPPSPDLARVELTGSVGELDMSQWFGGGALATQPGFAWAVDDLHVARARYNSVAFDDLVANAAGDGDTWQASVSAPDLAGDVVVARGQPTRLSLRRLKLPERAGESGGDPLAAIDPRAIGDFDVALERVQLGDADYGSWNFETRAHGTALAIDKLVADVKGLHIDSPSGTQWIDDGQRRTLFKGTVQAGNLATVLPQWGYAATLETTAALLDADVQWDGSPFNFALPRLAGRMHVEATKGRFVDAGDGAGAVRIFSLLNFTAIAKRMAFDFSDVFGKGISFDKVSATARADLGTMTLVEPMVIEGTGGSFSINGTVNFMTGALDNEMLVTLPVSSSLPWYAAYLGFVNPLAAGAVLVGERIFRNQIEKFSTAKYKVSGTLQDPKVTFVQVFPKALEGTVPAAAQSSDDANSTESPAGNSPAPAAGVAPAARDAQQKDKDA
jgi:uncharacterized protein (TIGR02099 family)